MPVAYKSKPFKDISLSFKRHPITHDILVLKNNDAIKKSIINLVKTNFGERVFNNSLGCDVTKSLFEVNSNLQSIGEILSDDIRTVVLNYEPRIKINKISATAVESNYSISIYIEYVIVGQNVEENIEFTLS